MSVQPIGAGSPGVVPSGGGRFFLPDATEFSGSLRLGEIIQGKVLRQYEGGRYLVSFNGHERVVDSSVPLQTGELIYGRVIGIGERVELQRVHSPDAETDRSAEKGAATEAQARALDRAEEVLDQLLSRYNVQLSQDDARTLTHTVRRADDSSAMALVGAIINKLGLKQTPELLWPIYNALTRRTDDASSLVQSFAARIDNVPVHAAAVSPTFIRQVADVIDRVVNQTAEEPSDQQAANSNPSFIPTITQPVLAPIKHISDDDVDRRSEANVLAYWLLNAQKEGSVAHRVGMVPLLLGDQLVEVEMSFFEQRRDAEQKPEAKHRKIVFSLQMPNLGRVEVMARLAGDHVSIQVATPAGEKTETLARYAEQLKSLLDGVGWTVDEIAYETRQGDGYNGAVRSVIEHVVNQDSLNRLI